MRVIKHFFYTFAVLAGVFIAPGAGAGEFVIGAPVMKNGMEIGAVYLQAVKMAPMLPGMQPADIHLEADIHGLKGNEQGFREGDWIPYLQISYHLEKQGSDWALTGAFMPMVASDGPHYGANIALAGSGRYRVTYHIDPPPYQGLYRHTDKETRVNPWWKPFDVQWDFTYLGTGKKGGY